MNQLEKAIVRLKLLPKDYTYSEARALLFRLGFNEYTKGKTSGSRVKFYRASDGFIILLHKPHPGDQMSLGATKALKDVLERNGDI